MGGTHLDILFNGVAARNSLARYLRRARSGRALAPDVLNRATFTGAEVLHPTVS